MTLEQDLLQTDDFTPKNLEDKSYTNPHTLDSLISVEPTEEDVDHVVDLVAEEVLKLWERFEFQFYEPEKVTEDNDYFMMFEIGPHADNKYEMFAKSMENGITEEDMFDSFFKKLQDGDILPMDGELGIEFVEDGTGIMDLRTGREVRVIVTFTTKALRDAREEMKDDE